MYVNDKSDFTLRVKLSRKKNNLNFLDFEDDAWINISCVMTLQSLENPDPIFKWTSVDKIETAKEFKNAGVELFSQKRYFDAFLAFRQALTLAW
jgi:hypothetical protein